MTYSVFLNLQKPPRSGLFSVRGYGSFRAWYPTSNGSPLSGMVRRVFLMPWWPPCGSWIFPFNTEEYSLEDVGSGRVFPCNIFIKSGEA